MVNGDFCHSLHALTTRTGYIRRHGEASSAYSTRSCLDQDGILISLGTWGINIFGHAFQWIEENFNFIIQQEWDFCGAHQAQSCQIALSAWNHLMSVEKAIQKIMTLSAFLISRISWPFTYANKWKLGLSLGRRIDQSDACHIYIVFH